MKLELENSTDLKIDDNNITKSTDVRTNDITLDVRTTDNNNITDTSNLTFKKSFRCLFRLRNLLIFQLQEGKPILVFGPHCNKLHNKIIFFI